MSYSTLPRVYAVVLNWNNFEDSMRCLDSLENAGHPNLRTIVVDNSSQDGSARRLHEEFPHLTLLLNPTNLGFARGCNVGMREALKDPECAYVLLLNNDATLSPGTLQAAVGFAAGDPRIGLLSGKILSSLAAKTIWYAGGRIDRWRGRAVARGFGEIDRGQYDSPCEVGFVTGAMMLIKRVVLEDTGLLPEEYFFGIEEWDFSLRVKRAGYKLYYFPDLLAYHRADGSHWNYDPKFVYNSYRSKLIFQEKYLPRYLFALWKRVFGLYGKYLARRARQRLIRRGGFDPQGRVQLDDLDFALTKALQDHGRNALSENVLTAFEAELNARRSTRQPQSSRSRVVS
ncbi:MAG TPA: glycosyltransferase family 2 protein [Pyrinomonadaceae bacterium]|nr:glycosyltransferase family 2 protein [Pyrinomonadaceae bacterium]